MDKAKKIIALLFVFVALALVSIAFAFVVHQIPIREVRTEVLGSYQSRATYDCVAKLYPNTIYNVTTLKPEEGTLYIRITQHINVTLNYEFQAPTTNANITYSLKRILAGETWQKDSTVISKITTNETRIKIDDIPPVDIDEISSLIREIEQETGTSSTRYNVTFSALFHITAETSFGRIEQTFNPALCITLDYRAPKGDIIKIEGLQHRKTETVTSEAAIVRHDVINQRYTSYVFIVASISGLAASIFMYRKFLPSFSSPEKKIEKLTKPHEEIIIKIESLVQMEGKETSTVYVKSLKDLVKTAELLAKPIMHFQESPQVHLFMVIEGKNRYCYRHVLTEQK